MLLWYLRQNDGDPSALALLAFKVMVFATAIADDEAVFGIGMWFTGFGMIFGPAWAYFLGLVYQYLRHDFLAKPRSH